MTIPGANPQPHPYCDVSIALPAWCHRDERVDRILEDALAAVQALHPDDRWFATRASRLEDGNPYNQPQTANVMHYNVYNAPLTPTVTAKQIDAAIPVLYGPEFPPSSDVARHARRTAIVHVLAALGIEVAR